MTNKIQILSPQIASQIAAGEVIERPASIVKELMENSLDAGSDEIILSIKTGGNSLINITDNGSGIVKADLHLAICQHATSKLQTLTDLESIQTLGFRGEALASISSAAKVKITSRARDAADDDHAWSLESAGDPNQYKIQPASHPVGTTIEVKDLFFNIPVRRRFLKAVKTEYQHILETFQKIALSNFACAFTLINDDKIVYKLPKAATPQAKDNRVRKIFGASFIKNSVYFEGSAASISIHGWLGNTDCHRSQADQQYFFLNNRVIRDKLIIHAIKYAHENFMPAGRHPCYVLYLNIDPNLVDINVHPTKHEVRFCEARWVHQFVVEQLSNVLSNISLTVFDEDQGNLVFDNEDDAQPILPINLDLSCGTDNNNHLESNKNFLPKYQDDLKNRPHSTQLMESVKKAAQLQALQSNKLTSEAVGNAKFAADQRLSTDTQDRVLTTQTHSVSSLGEILTQVSDNHVLSRNAQAEVFMVDIIAGYQALTLNKLTSEWQDQEQLTSCHILIKPSIALGELWSKLPEQGANKEMMLNCLQSQSKIIRRLGLEYELVFDQASEQSIEQSGLGQSASYYLEFTDSSTGELINSIKLTAVPHTCRYGNYSNILLAIVNSMMLDCDLQNINRLFDKLANLSASRLTDNLLLAEQQAIVDKLARNQYNTLHNKTPCVTKKLTIEDCRAILSA